MEQESSLERSNEDIDPVSAVLAAKVDYILPAGEHALRALESRRSIGQAFLAEPGPNGAELQRILTIATRVPDHGKLEPWRMLVFSGDARMVAGERLSTIFRA